MKKLGCFLLFLFSSFSLFSQRVSNANFTQVGKTVEITYTLDKQADIAVYLSTDGGKTFGQPLRAVSGDAGKAVQPGNRKIVWSPFEEYDKLVTDDAVFKIVPSGGEKLTFTVGGVSFTMIYVEGGTFTMGCTSEQGGDCDDDEKAVHTVTLSDYYIGQTEVTQALWQAVMGTNPSYFKGSNNPVESVSWDDCDAFVKKLSQLTGRRFALPTEAQWEYAARGGKKSGPYKYDSGHYKYAGSNSIGNVAWYDDNSNSSTHPVAQKLPNELGLYDMSGNVWEWCLDWYGAYSTTSQTNPTGPSSGSSRMLRGGSWNFNAQYCRVAYRYNFTPTLRYKSLGFRVVLLR